MVILEAPMFGGYQDPRIFNIWLHEIDQFSKQEGLLDKVCQEETHRSSYVLIKR